MADISAVFTIGYVDATLGEDEDWLYELSITEYGIECLREIVADQRAAGNASPKAKSAK